MICNKKEVFNFLHYKCFNFTIEEKLCVTLTFRQIQGLGPKKLPSRYFNAKCIPDFSCFFQNHVLIEENLNDIQKKVKYCLASKTKTSSEII